MPLPETEVHRVERWCRARIRPEYANELRIEADLTKTAVTIVELRPPWDDPEGEWIRFPIARFRYASSTGLWTLLWRDRNLRFHLYRYTEPTPNLQALLDHVGTSGDPIFWG